MNDEMAYDDELTDDELTDDDIADFIDDEDDEDDDEDGAPLAVDEFLELPYEEQRAYGEEHFDHGCDEPDEYGGASWL